ncbi:MAG: hypothetical protein HYW33_00030 [Candidatus Blackburnbacteria bacterium]|nr:hypothetical protein [Candidatus Blackburnbacteria bacterium]
MAAIVDTIKDPAQAKNVFPMTASDASWPVEVVEGRHVRCVPADSTEVLPEGAVVRFVDP